MGNKQQTSVSAHTGILTPLLVILYLYSGLLVAWFLGGTSSLELTRQLMVCQHCGTEDAGSENCLLKA